MVYSAGVQAVVNMKTYMKHYLTNYLKCSTGSDVIQQSLSVAHKSGPHSHTVRFQLELQLDSAWSHIWEKCSC